MTVGELAKALDCELLTQGDITREVTGGYCGDLLSWVMGRAAAGDVWITVMGNRNAVAVAVLADTACILLAEDAALDADATERARSEGVAILRSGKSAFALAHWLGERLSCESTAALGDPNADIL